MQKRLVSELICQLSDYEFISNIGEGSFGNVGLYKHTKTGKEYAIKVMKSSLDLIEDKQSFMKEVEIMNLFSHPGIIQVHGFTFDNPGQNQHAAIITEYMPQGSLEDMLEKESRGIAPPEWNPTTKANIAFNIAATMMYIHDNGGCHRDLKPQNILLDSNLGSRIADFGLATFRIDDPNKTPNVGTPRYMAPELFEGKDYNQTVDQYSYGMIVYQLFTSIVPFGDFKTSFAIYNYVKNGGRPLIPDGMSEYLKSFILCCWDQCPLERRSFRALVNYMMKNDVFPNINNEIHRNYIRTIVGTTLPPKPEKPLIGTGATYKSSPQFQSSASNTQDMNQNGSTTQSGNAYQPPFKPNCTESARKTKTCPSMTDTGTKSYPRVIKTSNSSSRSSVKKEEITFADLLMQANAGHVQAQLKVGLTYLNGYDGIAKDFQKAVKFLKDAASQGNGDASYQLIKLEKENRVEIPRYVLINLYKSSADSGNLDSMVDYGQALIQGDDAQDIKLGMNYIKKAANGGLARACNMLGATILKYSDSEDDRIQAFKLFNQAAIQNDPEGLYFCGLLLEKGIGTRQDNQKSLRMFKQSADFGYVEAQLHYGKLLLSSDARTGIKYLLMSAENGNKDAKEKLGEIWVNYPNIRNLPEAPRIARIKIDPIRYQRANISLEQMLFQTFFS